MLGAVIVPVTQRQFAVSAEGEEECVDGLRWQDNGWRLSPVRGINQRRPSDGEISVQLLQDRKGLYYRSHTKYIGANGTEKQPNITFGVPIMTTIRSFILAAALSVGLALSAPASALSYTALDLGDALNATGINASGQVVGVANIDAGTWHGFVTGANGSGMTELGTLGGTQTVATGINASGQVTGYARTADNVFEHAYITGANGSGMTDLGTLGGMHSNAYGINASGQVVGTANTTDEDIWHAFITGPNGSGMRDLGTLGGTYSGARGINAKGQVVGSSRTSDSSVHAFITGANGVGMTDLGTLGGMRSDAYGINTSGQVVGSSRTSDSSDHAFITGANGVGMTDLGTLGGTHSNAMGINTSGQVVGYVYSYTNGYLTFEHAFITGANGAGMTDLNSLVTLNGNAFLTIARGINDAGQIIASGSNDHYYLLTPAVPEPEHYAMMLAGLGLIGATVRRKKQRITGSDQGQTTRFSGRPQHSELTLMAATELNQSHHLHKEGNSC